MKIWWIAFVLLPELGLAAPAKVSKQDYMESCLGTFQAQAQVSTQQISSLCEASLKEQLSFNILARHESPTCKRTLVILGEDHEQGAAAFKTGTAILNQYPVRGIESVPESEFAKLKDATALNAVATHSQALAKKLARDKGGTLTTKSADKGIYFDFNQTLINGKSLEKINTDQLGQASSEKWAVFVLKMTGPEFPEGVLSTCTPGVNPHPVFNLKAAQSVFADAPTYLRTFSAFIGKKGFPVTTANIENGPLETYDIACKKFEDAECARYVHTERNKRMAKNTALILDEMPCDIPLLIIVGDAHVGPLTRRMQQKGYQSLQDIAIYGTYSNYGADPAFPED